MNSQNSASASAPDSDKDSRLKYVQMGRVFRDRASMVDLSCKVSQKSCEKLAAYLAKQNPKTPEEMDKVEALKKFVLTTSKANEEMIALIDYVKGLLEDIAIDSNVLIQGAILRDKLKFQSDTIEYGWQVREEMIEQIKQTKLDEIRRTNTANS